MNIREKINSARARLAAAGIENGEAGRDANLLARHVLAWDRAMVYSHENDGAEAAFTERLKRAGRLPEPPRFSFETARFANANFWRTRQSRSSPSRRALT